ncbi:MAG: DNA topoisomerase 3 [Ruminococcus sp.]|nr:DNA topoisomerase 3 [Ruminococcus sp.]
MKLVIAEKPSVARAIAPVLGANAKKDGCTEGNGYIVSWCFGHLVGLSMPNDYGDMWKSWSFETLPMIPDKWKFKVTDSCKAQFNILKKLMNDSRVDEIICATDADREGECIFRYVYNLSGCRKPVKRLWVSSLEESAIRDGMNKLKDGREYDNLYYAGFARAKSDWLVGMNGSRLFSIRYKAKLNTGRVQTPTLAMIVQRDYDVKNFVKQKYFTVELDCGTFTASSERIDDEAAAQRIAASCNGKTATITEAKRETKKSNPPKLYDLTTLQRDANKLLGYTAQQTLDYMQSLYEAKLVTYPRTDSQYLSDDMEESTLNVVNALFHAEAFKPIAPDVPFAPDIKRSINNKKVTGHHAIIPTINGARFDLESLPSGERNILLLVASRLMCAAAAPHEYISMSVKVSCEGTVFSANGKKVTETGWKSLDDKAKAVFKNLSKSKDEESSEDEKSLPELTEGQTFDNVSAKKAQHWTSPPKPYTEATLLSAMEHAGQDEYDDETEKKGLGTPATRAGIIEALVKNGYAERKSKQITATEKGVNLIQVVPDEVKSPKLTADWEMQLQHIERGECSHDAFMQEITGFVRGICSKYGSSDSSVSFTTGNCPKCGKEIKKGNYGFYCTGRCGMNIGKVYGKELTETQVKKLLSGSSVSYTKDGKKTVVLPEVVENEYNGKTFYQWRTKRW